MAWIRLCTTGYNTSSLIRGMRGAVANGSQPAAAKHPCTAISSRTTDWVSSKVFTTCERSITMAVDVKLTNNLFSTALPIRELNAWDLTRTKLDVGKWVNN